MAITLRPNTIVRAYDLGGFGDIAGAMRVASHLQRTGHQVGILPKSQSALDKLNILNPDVPISVSRESYDGSIQIDIAGHYRDERNPANNDVPHQFTEDMDNLENRRSVVPIYVKTGLTKARPQVSESFSSYQYTPMFYRPFREWDLPKPGERDARDAIMRVFPNSAGVLERLKHGLGLLTLERTIQDIETVGFAHLSPVFQTLAGTEMLRHPYFNLFYNAALNSSQPHGLGLFVDKKVERRLAYAALEESQWGVVRSNGHVEKYNPRFPTLIFLVHKPSNNN